MNRVVKINAVDWRALLFFSVIALFGFGLLFFPQKFYYHQYVWQVWPVLVLSIILYNRKQIYGKYLILMQFFLFINAVGCYINRDQTLLSYYSGLEYCTISMINIYFIAVVLKNEVKDYEKLLYSLSIIMCAIYIIQYYLYPIPIVNGALYLVEKGWIDQGTRFRMIGQSLAFLAYFMGLTKYLVSFKIKFLLQFVLGGIVLIMLGFRIQLFFVAIFTLILYWKIFKFSYKVFWAFLFFGLLIYYFVLDLPFVKLTIDAIVERQDKGESDEIRWYAIDYFQNYFFKNTWETIWGAGLPGKNSSYCLLVDNLKDRMIIFADIGVWGLSWMAGIPATLIIVLYPIVAYFKKVPKEYLYIGITLLCVLLSSIFTREIYRDGNPFIFGIMLAMQEKILNNENRNFNFSLLS